MRRNILISIFCILLMFAGVQAEEFVDGSNTVLSTADINTLAELNTIVADATLLDDGAIADSNAIGLATGATHATFGAAGDDTIDEIITAIDGVIGVNAGLVDTDDKIIAIINASPGTQISVAAGGSGAGIFTNGGLLVGATTGAFEAVAVGLATEVLVGGGAGTNPAWGTDLPTALTIGTAYIYRVGGTDVADADVVDTLTISGGTVNNSVIGGSTPAAGTFTSVSVAASADPLIQLTDSDAGDGDVGFEIDADASATGTGAEDYDDANKAQIAGALTTYSNFDADVTNTMQTMDSVLHLGAATIPTAPRLYSAHYTSAQTLVREECFNSTIYVSNATVITLPVMEYGMVIHFVTVTAHAISIDAHGDDDTDLDAVASGVGEKSTSGSTAGELITYSYFDADGWYAASDGWTDGGA